MSGQSSKRLRLSLLTRSHVNIRRVSVNRLASNGQTSSEASQSRQQMIASTSGQATDNCSNDEDSSVHDNGDFAIETERTLEFRPEPPDEFRENYSRYRDDLLWYILALRTRHCWSDVDLKTFYIGAKALSGGFARVPMSEVLQLEKIIVAEADPLLHNLCGICFEILAPATATCLSPACLQHLGKRSTVSESIHVVTYDIRKSVLSVVQSSFADILSLHTALHAGRATYQGDDTVNSVYFKANIENQVEFQANNLKLQAIVNIDGFSFDSQYGGSMWPLTLSILDLRPSLRNSPKALISAGYIRGPSKPPQRALRLLFERLLSTLQRHFPLIVQHNGIVYSFRLSVTYSAMDNEALALCYDHSTFHSGRCLHCQVVAPRIAGVYHYPTAAGLPKDAQWLAAATAAGQFDGDSPFNQLLPVYYSAIDALHLFEEGFEKDIIRAMLYPSRRDGLRVKSNVIHAMDDLVSCLRTPTYFPARLTTFSRCLSSSGSGINLHLFISVPLLILRDSMKRKIDSTFIFLCINAKRYTHIHDLSMADMQVISELYEDIEKLWIDVFGTDCVTPKVHLLTHARRMMQDRGNLLSFSTHGFEHNNLFLKQLLSPLNTAAFDRSSMQRQLVWRKVHEEIYSRAQDTRLIELRELVESIDKGRLRCVLGATSFTASVRIDLSKTLPLPDPNDIHWHLFDRLQQQLNDPTIKYHSRVAWRRFQLATHLYWPRPRTTQSDLICYHTPAGRAYGRILLIASVDTPPSVYCLIKTIPTKCSTDSILDFLRTSTHHLSARILQSLLKCPTLDCWVEINPTEPSHYVILSCDDISELAVEISYANNDYIFSLPTRDTWI